jgi:hypothetical protein
MVLIVAFSGDPRSSGSTYPSLIGVAPVTTTAAAASSSAAPSTSSSNGPTTVPTTLAPAPSSTVAPTVPLGPARPLPPGGLYAGARPPQFVLVSFDGAADQTLLERWMRTGALDQAHLTFFLSSVYLLGAASATDYHGPRHPAGQSAIGFAPVKEGQDVASFLRTTVGGLQAAQRAGHELAQHFGGHWCGATGVSTWTAADWSSELDQVDALAAHIDANNALDPGVGNPFVVPPAGARTPCLEGRWDQLEPVLASRGYRYDASPSRGLLDWPKSRNGLWVYGFPTVAIPGHRQGILAVDYSLYVNLAGGKDVSAARSTEIEQQVLDGYLGAFDQLYNGNRAPFEIGNHFTSLSGDAYNRAVERFLVTVCPQAEVHCVTYRELTDWMDAHRDQIPAFQAGTFPRLATP